jgi:hypothetical protein
MAIWIKDENTTTTKRRAFVNGPSSQKVRVTSHPGRSVVVCHRIAFLADCALSVAIGLIPVTFLEIHKLVRRSWRIHPVC